MLLSPHQFKHVKTGAYTLLCVAIFFLVGVGAAPAQEIAPVPPMRPDAAADQDANEKPMESVEAETTQKINIPVYDSTPQPLRMVARSDEQGRIIREGLEWRVYSTVPDEAGNLKLLARSREATPTFNLPVASYIAHVAYGHAQASDTVPVQKGDNQHELILDIGGLELSAAIRGDISIPERWLRFTVFSNESAPGGRQVVAQAVEPGQRLYLNSGTYDIVSYFGDVNAVSRASLEVVPGELTSATLYHNASVLTFRLVSEAGGEAIADTKWIVKTPDGETVFEEQNTFPQAILAEGEYILIAQLGDRVFNREFESVPGLPRKIEVVTPR